MTRHDLRCIHEPFGDAFYYGPERLSSRFENDEKARVESGFSETTYKNVFDRLSQESSDVWQSSLSCSILLASPYALQQSVF